MAVRLRSEFTAYGHKPPVNKYFVLEVHDTTLEIDADIDFSMRSSPIHGYDPESNDIFYPVRSSTLSFNIIIENGNTDLESFLTDYVAAPEGQFIVRLKRFVSVGVYETIFIGKLLHDITTLVKSKNPVLSLSAVDPFLELEHIEYDVSGYPQTWGKIIIDHILYESPIIQYFYPDNSDEILHIYNKWKDVLHTDTTDILSSTYMQNYFSRENDGQIERKKVVYVLAELLRGLAARIYFEDGVFVIEQIKSRADTSVTYSRYSKDQTFLGTSTHDQVTFDFDNSIAYQIDVDPEITFLPPINSVVLSQNGDYVENLLFGYDFNYLAAVEGPYLISQVTELIDQKVYCRLVINPFVETFDDYTIGYYKYLYMVFDVQIRVGGKYLKAKSGIGYTFNQVLKLDVTDAEWSNFTDERVRIYIPAYVMYNNIQNNAKDIFYIIDIISPILEEIGDVYFDFRYINTYTNIALSGAINPILLPDPYTLKWDVNSNSIAILKDIEESEHSGTTVTTLVNNTNNTKIYTTSYDMGSFPEGTSKQRLKVNDVDTDSVNWVHPDFGNMPFQFMAMEDIRSMYANASQVFVTTMRLNKVYPGVLKMRHRMLYDGDYFIPIYIEANLVEETAVCLWFSVDVDLVAVDPPVISTPNIPIIKGGLTGPTSTTTSLQGNETSTNTNTFFKHIASLTGDSTDLSDYEGFPDPDIVTSDSINMSWEVHIGGTWYRFANVAQGSLSQGEFTLDFDNKLILWNRDQTGKNASILIIDRYIIDTDNQTN